MIVAVPAGQDPIIHVWGEMVPGIGPAAAAFSHWGARPAGTSSAGGTT